MNEYAVIVDPAKKRDFAATMVLKDSPQLVLGQEFLKQPNRIVHFYDIIYLQQKQRVPYHEIVEDTCQLMKHAALAENADLLVDATGVGEAVIEIMREKGLRPIPLVTTPGGQVHEVYADVGDVFSGIPSRLKIKVLQEIHVPKADLVAAGQLLVEQERIRIAAGLRWAEEARTQFKRFRGKINERTKRKVYEAETEEDHDDFVICFLMGAWWFVKHRPQEELKEQAIEKASLQSRREAETGDWNPYDFW